MELNRTPVSLFRPFYNGMKKEKEKSSSIPHPQIGEQEKEKIFHPIAHD